MKSLEAKTKMCPFQQHPEKTINCIADKCMSWCWDYKDNDEGYCSMLNIDRTLYYWLENIASRR
jgi:hypothetical protein